MLLPYLVDFLLYVMRTNFFTGPKPTKPIKPIFYRLWGFMLDMFELDGGLKAQKLRVSPKWCFPRCGTHKWGKPTYSHIPNQQNQQNQLFVDFGDLCWTRLKWMVGWKLKVSEKFVYWFYWFGHHTKVGFPSKSQHFQGDTYKTLVRLYMLLFSEKRDSRNTFGLDAG